MLLYWKVQIMKRPCWYTEITVKTWPRAFEKVSSWRDFEMYAGEELIALGTSEWVLIDSKKQSISRITDKMKEEYGLYQKSVFLDSPSGKIKEPENLEKIFTYTGARRDIDANNHVNNISYLEIAYEALPKEVELSFENIEIFYKKQIKLRRNC